MKKVCLRFETILRLFDFLEVMVITKCRIDRITNVVICELSDADIELAKKCYRAKVVGFQRA